MPFGEKTNVQSPSSQEGAAQLMSCPLALQSERSLHRWLVGAVPGSLPPDDPPDEPPDDAPVPWTVELHASANIVAMAMAVDVARARLREDWFMYPNRDATAAPVCGPNRVDGKPTPSPRQDSPPRRAVRTRVHSRRVNAGATAAPRAHLRDDSDDG